MEHSRIRISLLIVIVTTICGVKINAQNSYFGRDIPVHLEAALEAGTPCNSILPFGASIDLSYYIKRLSIHIVTNTDYHILKDGLSSDYNKSTNLGGGIGYTFLPTVENGSGGFEARATVTTSLKSYDFKNTSYKIGVYWMGGYSVRKLVSVIGVGFNFTDYSTKLPSYKGAFLSFGIRF